MEEKLTKILEELAVIKATNQSLEERLAKVEEGSIGSGVYLDGCPQYAQEYIVNKNKKDGE